MTHTECRTKESRVRRFLRQAGLNGILLTRQPNFAWMTCGGDNHVVTASEGGVATLLFTPERKIVLTTNIEAQRIMEEEVCGLGYDLVSYPWHEATARAAAIRKHIRGLRVASDDGVAGTPPLGEAFTELRYSLTEQEVKRYRALGHDCSEAMEEAGRRVARGQAEHQIASEVCRAFLARDIVPVVVLIAADERAMKYRHPIYKNKKVDRHVMIVMCGRRKGLIVSLTRLVHFGRLPDDLRRKHDACCAVDAAFNLGSKPGASLGSVLQNAIRVYERTGFPEEWRLHHQGGTTGYGGRDVIATPGQKEKIHPNQALAWNPSIAGTKSEDTIIVRKNGIEVISRPIQWPTIEAEWNGKTIRRADILVK